MNYWSDIRHKLNAPIKLGIQLLFFTVAAYIFIMAEEQRHLKVIVLFFGLLSWVFLSRKTKHSMLWMVCFILLSFDLYYSYFWVANHHFMMIFMVLSILFYSYHKRSDILLINIQILVVVVVMASAIQKLMSSQFMSGEFFYYMINQGSAFTFLFNFFPEILEVTKSNSESILALKATDPNHTQSIILKDIFPNLGLISYIFARITVALEFMVAIAILYKPRSKWTHLFFIIMIIGILCTRFETGFMALLGVCGIFLCNELKLRLLYVMIVLACITLVITKLGYH